MAKTKTFITKQDVTEFINSVKSEQKRKDSFQLVDIMSKMSGEKPYMWGPSIIGFGSYHYIYESGHEGDAPLYGFSPRSGAITVYMSSEFPGRKELLSQLGECKASVACLYIKKLDDIKIPVLKKIIKASAIQTKKLYPG